jgi:hypothetical protein
MPPNLIRVEAVWWLDGAMGRLTYGWTICEGEELALCGMEARPFRNLDLGLEPSIDDVSDALRAELARLAPF